MAKKRRKVARKKATRPKGKKKVEIPVTFAPAAAQKFVSDVRIRGESGPLKDGKLAKGLTHIETKKGSTVELTRARFKYA